MNEKTLRAKVLRRVSENLSGMLYQLFSSFLRGASCPKSPRAPPLPATLFMRLTARDVKAENIRSQFEGLREARPKQRTARRTGIRYKKRAKANIKALQQNGALVRQMDRQANCKRQIEQGRHPSLGTVLIPAHKLSAASGPYLQ